MWAVAALDQREIRHVFGQSRLAEFLAQHRIETCAASHALLHVLAGATGEDADELRDHLARFVAPYIDVPRRTPIANTRPAYRSYDCRHTIEDRGGTRHNFRICHNRNRHRIATRRICAWNRGRCDGRHNLWRGRC